MPHVTCCRLESSLILDMITQSITHTFTYILVNDFLFNVATQILIAVVSCLSQQCQLHLMWSLSQDSLAFRVRFGIRDTDRATVRFGLRQLQVCLTGLPLYLICLNTRLIWLWPICFNTYWIRRNAPSCLTTCIRTSACVSELC